MNEAIIEPPEQIRRTQASLRRLAMAFRIGLPVVIVLAVVGVLSMCGMLIGGTLDVVGGVVASFSPISLLFAIVYPADTIPGALETSVSAGRISLVVGSIITAVVYALIVYGMHNNQKRTFMMTVRKLAGQT